MIDKLLYDWPLFHFSITHRSLYILGAGASLPNVKPNSDELRKIIWDNGIYDVVSHPPSLLRTRLLPPKSYSEPFLYSSIPQNELDAHTPINLIDILFARMITVPEVNRVAQYEVFELFPASMIFNFNNDNLSDGIHHRHCCMYPHRRVNFRLAHSSVLSRGILMSAISDSTCDALDFHRPLPEPSDITSHQCYLNLLTKFESIQSVVIIGYSFGAQGDGSIDDSESFDMIVDLLRWRPKRVLIIDPDPWGLFSRINAVIKENAVSILRCKWNVLADFILSGAYTKAFNQGRLNGLQEITLLYRIFEEIEASKKGDEYK